VVVRNGLAEHGNARGPMAAIIGSTRGQVNAETWRNALFSERQSLRFQLRNFNQ
jgi:hypothetical protein